LPNQQSVSVSGEWTCHRDVTMNEELASECEIKAT
jgi:hypothetical protein